MLSPTKPVLDLQSRSDVLDVLMEEDWWGLVPIPWVPSVDSSYFLRLRIFSEACWSSCSSLLLLNLLDVVVVVLLVVEGK